MRVALSGLSGCGNTTVSKLVAKKLGVPLLNYTFRDLAKDLGVGFDELHARALKSDEFDLGLDRKLIGKANALGDCVVASRLAIWLVDAKFKAWLHAPLRVRAARIAGREGWTLDHAVAHTRERDSANALRYKKIYGIDVGSHGGLAETIDVGGKTAGEAAELIAGRAKASKKVLPADARVLKVLRE